MAVLYLYLTERAPADVSSYLDCRYLNVKEREENSETF